MKHYWIVCLEKPRGKYYMLTTLRDKKTLSILTYLYYHIKEVSNPFVRKMDSREKTLWKHAESRGLKCIKVTINEVTK